MSAPAAALVTFVTVIAIMVVVMAVLFLVGRVQALRSTVQELHETLDPALTSLQGDAEVARTELVHLQEQLEQGRPGRR